MNNVFELHHQIKQQIALNLVFINTNTTTFGNIIDTAAYTALEFFILTGFVSDPGNYTMLLEHGDDSGLSDATMVAAGEILGNADFTAADDNVSKRLGYIGKKRYVRLSIVSTDLDFSSGIVGAVAVLGGSIHQPVAD
jgi:hypothetical protein